METILIISTLVAIVISFSIWKIWKWFEYKAWIEPARFDALIKAIHLMGEAFLLASTAIGRFGISMQEAIDETDRIKLAKGGLEGKILTRNADGKFVEIESMEYIGKDGDAHKVLFNTKPFEGESRINF